MNSAPKKALYIWFLSISQYIWRHTSCLFLKKELFLYCRLFVWLRARSIHGSISNSQRDVRPWIMGTAVRKTVADVVYNGCGGRLDNTIMMMFRLFFIYFSVGRFMYRISQEIWFMHPLVDCIIMTTNRLHLTLYGIDLYVAIYLHKES
jgi:hypothetical protein